MSQSDWKGPEFERVRSEIKTKLESIERDQGIRAVFSFGISELARLESTEETIGQIQRYLYINYLLIYHSRYEGLPAKVFKQLPDLATAILLSEGIKRETSRLGYLHGDIHLILSQIERTKGRQDEALWNQQLSCFFSARGPADREAFQSLSLGIQYLRSGYATLALAEFSQVKLDCLQPARRARLCLETHKALRLSGQFEKAESLPLADEVKCDSEFLEEWTFEKIWLGIQQGEPISTLIQSVRALRSFENPTFILETFLLTRAVRSRKDLKLFPTFISLKRVRSEVLKQEKALYTAASAIENAYNSDIPYLQRLDQIRSILTGSNVFRSVDNELLFRAAALRWLSRHSAPLFLPLVRKQYESLCLRLTDGKQKDVLGIVADITGRQEDMIKEIA